MQRFNYLCLKCPTDVEALRCRAASSNAAGFLLKSECTGDNEEHMGFCDPWTLVGAVRQTTKFTCSSMLQQHTNNVTWFLKECCKALITVLQMSYRRWSIESLQSQATLQDCCRTPSVKLQIIYNVVDICRVHNYRNIAAALMNSTVATIRSWIVILENCESYIHMWHLLCNVTTVICSFSLHILLSLQHRKIAENVQVHSCK